MICLAKRTRALLCAFGVFAACAEGGAARDPRPGAIPNGRVSLQPGPDSCAPNCRDFPERPLFDGEAQAADVRAFGPVGELRGSGPCLLEPELSQGDRPGAMFPRNWLRPRFRWQPLPGEDRWELRISAAEQLHPLVVYTSNTHWTLPRELWRGLASHNLGSPIAVTLRGLARGARGRPSGTQGTFSIAPSDATGKLVYWATSSSEVRPDSSKLAGFAVGDETVLDVLRVPQLTASGILTEGGRNLRGQYDNARGVPAGHVQCIGCHVSTPDGDAVAFTDHWPWNTVLASLEPSRFGQAPSYLSQAAQRLLSQPWLGMTTFSPAHFRPGDRVLVTSYSPRNAGRGEVGWSDGAPYPSHRDGLAWFDLESAGDFAGDPTRGDVQQQLNQQAAASLGTGFGLLALEGETRSAATPSFSRDGTRIVYSSADSTQDGRIGADNREVDLHVVPYTDRKGGPVSAIEGAAEPGVAEYYPAFSSDDRWLAFTRVAELDRAPIYYRPDGEIYVVPSAGGSATRLVANDPPACSGQRSPGVINSWPKWSPGVSVLPPQNQEFSFRYTYYWLIFSSARAYEGQFMLPKAQSSANDARSSQLYMAALVYNEDTRELASFPAIYLWNQDPATSNLTPAWDEFKLPVVPGPD